MVGNKINILVTLDENYVKYLKKKRRTLFVLLFFLIT